MAIDPVSVGLQALGIIKGAATPAPAVSGSSGNFANQYQQNGPAPWTLVMGGGGEPRVAQAFRPDSLVMGMTGLSTATNKAVGNGTAINQPAAITNSLFQNPFMWVALAVAVVGVAWVSKK